MIPKNAYCLFCSMNEGKDQIIYPEKRCGPGEFHFRAATNEDFYFDFFEVKEYVNKYLKKDCRKVIICKITDILNIEAKSIYEDEND